MIFNILLLHAATDDATNGQVPVIAVPEDTPREYQMHVDENGGGLADTLGHASQSPTVVPVKEERKEGVTETVRGVVEALIDPESTLKWNGEKVTITLDGDDDHAPIMTVDALNTSHRRLMMAIEKVLGVDGWYIRTKNRWCNALHGIMAPATAGTAAGGYYKNDIRAWYVSVGCVVAWPALRGVLAKWDTYRRHALDTELEKLVRDYRSFPSFSGSATVQFNAVLNRMFEILGLPLPKFEKFLGELDTRMQSPIVVTSVTAASPVTGAPFGSDNDDNAGASAAGSGHDKEEAAFPVDPQQ